MVLPKITDQDESKMPRFIIEVSHPTGTEACARAVYALLKYGSHYITHADWGCLDGVHKAWLIVDVDCKDTAKCIVPPNFRGDAKVTELTKFSLPEIESMLQKLSGEQPS